MLSKTEDNFMDIEPFRYIYHSEYFKFSMCGLDVRKNFIHSNRNDRNTFIEIDGEYGKGVKDLCLCFLSLSITDKSAVFALCQNGDIYIAVHTPEMDDGAECYLLTPKIGINRNYYVLGDFVKGLGLSSYGLFVETNNGVFKLIEE